MGLTDRERILKIYQNEPIDQVVFQPRIMYWMTRNHVNVPLARHDPKWTRFDPTIPEEFFGMDPVEIHDALHTSIRYPAETLGLHVFSTRLNSGSEIKSRVTSGEHGEAIVTTETPVGTVREASKVSAAGSSYPIEHMVKTPEDIEVVEYILDHTIFEFNQPGFDLAEEVLEGRGITQSFYNRSPYMRCILNYIGFENTVLMLRRHKNAVEDFMKFMAEWDDAMYDVIVDSPVKLLNFGENIDANLVPPKYFNAYCIPYYNRRIKQLHDAGKFTFIHMDGSMKDLLPFIQEMDFDGIEAATPEPQGDVTVDEIKEALGDKVLVDGIPATLFLPHYSESMLEDTVTRLIDLFGSRLILGVSDELAPNCQIGRFALVSKIVEEKQLQ
ncbi:MAG TPA: uroporphyrinogen decarboxylase family protein [Candidatus Lokiarchaeia archaeon]|nr:uroporphyrinogen decarboxylase family protein [Candidatus Lokiarchaeia archaeon]